MPVRAFLWAGKAVYDLPSALKTGNFSKLKVDLLGIIDCGCIAYDQTCGAGLGFYSEYNWANNILQSIIPEKFRGGFTKQGYACNAHDEGRRTSGSQMKVDLALANPSNWNLDFQPIGLTYGILASTFFGAKAGLAKTFGIDY